MFEISISEKLRKKLSIIFKKITEKAASNFRLILPSDYGEILEKFFRNFRETRETMKETFKKFEKI